MDVTGELVDKHNLTGDETLVELLNKFKVQSNRPMPDFLPAMNEHCKNEFENKREGIRNTLMNILSEVPLECQQEDINVLMRRLAREYVCLGFEQKYDRINSGMFELKRIIDYSKKGESDEPVEIEMPVFACAKFGEKIWKFDYTYDTKFHRHTYNVTAKCPPITRDAKIKAKEATAKAQEAAAKAKAAEEAAKAAKAAPEEKTE